jgi:hypothetical protein
MNYQIGDIVEIQEFPNAWYRAVIKNPNYVTEFGSFKYPAVLVEMFDKIQFSGGIMGRIIFDPNNIRPVLNKN